jgi:putative endonuclease
MSRARQERGRAGESAAEAALVAAGFKILLRNYRCRVGEIDLIAREGDVLCFVEVKARGGDSRQGDPFEKVTLAKRRTIARVASLFLAQRPALARATCRFDVVGVWMGPDDAPVRTEIRRDAFRVGE